MRIDRCVCYDVTFEKLRITAEACGADTVEALQQHVRFGLNCGMCRPYVRRMLRTGEVVFSEIITDDASAPEA